MDSTKRIYSYNDPVKFLAAEMKRLKIQDKNFSLREWSRRLGYQNPSYLSDVLKGRRKLTLAFSILLARSLELDEKETRFLEVMTLVHRSKNLSEKRQLMRLLNSLRPKELKNSTDLTTEQFALIADWYNWALAEMPRLKDFKTDVNYIAKKLGNQIPKESIEESIDILVRNKILTRTADGELKRSSEGPDFLDPEITKLAAREYHKQMARKAIEALENKKSEDLDFQGSTFCIKKSDVIKLREIIRDFHQKILELGVEDDGDEIYQIHTQLFPLD